MTTDMDVFQFTDEACEKIRESDEYQTVIQYADELFTQRATINTKITSYGLKHHLEKYLKNKGKYEISYVSNQAMCLALNDLGYNRKVTRKWSPNYCFNISVNSCL